MFRENKERIRLLELENERLLKRIEVIEEILNSNNITKKLDFDDVIIIDTSTVFNSYKESKEEEYERLSHKYRCIMKKTELENKY